MIIAKKGEGGLLTLIIIFYCKYNKKIRLTNNYIYEVIKIGLNRIKIIKSKTYFNSHTKKTNEMSRSHFSNQIFIMILLICVLILGTLTIC